jgi:hypothetical protein
MLRTQKAIIIKTSEKLYFYIPVYTNIQTPDKGSRSPLDILIAYGYSMIY